MTDQADEEPYECGQKWLWFVSSPGVMLKGEGHAVRIGMIGETGRA